ncbi:hypothetical protein BDZ91DRAFT_712164 [Kalaharituber pfeilii]|nr:hypothetical protein BDZ91DRAFT_712164 [Kalaharituber pfeilii]
MLRSRQLIASDEGLFGFNHWACFNMGVLAVWLCWGTLFWSSCVWSVILRTCKVQI